MKIAPPPALTLSEARSLLAWLDREPYPRDDYQGARDAPRKIRAIAHPPPTQEKAK